MKLHFWNVISKLGSPLFKGRNVLSGVFPFLGGTTVYVWMCVWTLSKKVNYSS